MMNSLFIKWSVPLLLLLLLLLLQDAKALGTFLLVGIYDDNTVANAKGEHHPLMNLMERVLNVCACKWVDEVCPHACIRARTHMRTHAVPRTHTHTHMHARARTPIYVPARRLGRARRAPSPAARKMHGRK